MKGLVLQMKARMISSWLLSVTALLPLSPAAAQVRPAPQAMPQGMPMRPAVPPAAAPNAAQQSPAAQPLPPPPAPPLPPPVWDLRNASDLVAFIRQIGSEGLNP